MHFGDIYILLRSELGGSIYFFSSFDFILFPLDFQRKNFPY